MTVSEAIRLCEGTAKSYETNVISGIEASELAEWLKEYKQMSTFVRTLEMCAGEGREITLFGRNYDPAD